MTIDNEIKDINTLVDIVSREGLVIRDSKNTYVMSHKILDDLSKMMKEYSVKDRKIHKEIVEQQLGKNIKPIFRTSKKAYDGQAGKTCFLDNKYWEFTEGTTIKIGPYRVSLKK